MRVTRTGFTLVEMVMVIVIIALLSALLLPVLTQARESARIKACISQMRQLWMGMDLYRQDNGGGPTDYPLYLSELYGAVPVERGDPPRIVFAYDVHRAYVSSDALFFCPDDADCGSCRLEMGSGAPSYLTTQFLGLGAPNWPTFAEALQLREEDTPLFVCPVHHRIGTRPHQLVIARVGGSVTLEHQKYPELGIFGY